MLARVLSVLALAVSFALASVVATSASDAGVASRTASPRPIVVYDTIGDAAGAADITSVAVARDPKNRVTFAINVADHPSPKRGDLFSVGLDTDRRVSTGDIGRVRLRPVGVCAWRMPRDAKGKTLMLQVSLAYGGDEWTSVYPLEVE